MENCLPKPFEKVVQWSYTRRFDLGHHPADSISFEETSQQTCSAGSTEFRGCAEYFYPSQEIQSWAFCTTQEDPFSQQPLRFPQRRSFRLDELFLDRTPNHLQRLSSVSFFSHWLQSSEKLFARHLQTHWGNKFLLIGTLWNHLSDRIFLPSRNRIWRSKSYDNWPRRKGSS